MVNKFMKQGQEAAEMVIIVTHGLSTRHLGTKQIELDRRFALDTMHLVLKIWEAWRFEIQWHRMDLSFVSPQPFEWQQEDVEPIHILLDFHPHRGGVALLTMINMVFTDGDQGEYESARVHGLTGADIRDAVGLGHLCAQMTCRLSVLRTRTFQMQQQIEMQHGNFFIFDVFRGDNIEHEDDMNLMQFRHEKNEVPKGVLTRSHHLHLAQSRGFDMLTRSCPPKPFESDGMLTRSYPFDGHVTDVLTRSHLEEQEHDGVFWMQTHRPSSANEHSTWPFRLSRNVRPNENAAGRLPSRAGEGTFLHTQIERDRYMDGLRHQEARRFNEEHTRVLKQEWITERAMDLSLLRDGKVLFVTFGIEEVQVGVEKQWIQTSEMEDFTDVLVQLRRPWHPDFREYDADVLFVEPQPNHQITGGTEAVVIIMDFMPQHRAISILITTTTRWSDSTPTHDTQAHRVSPITNCREIKRITGMTMVCEMNAVCKCSPGRQFLNEDELLLLGAGQHVVLDIDFREMECHENDDILLMQTSSSTSQLTKGDNSKDPAQEKITGQQNDASPLWVYAFVHGWDQPLKIWHADHPRYDVVTYMVSQVIARDPHGVSFWNYHVAKTVPQPDDLKLANIPAYLVIHFRHLRCYENPILLDVFWEDIEAIVAWGPHYAAPRWRKTVVIHFRVNRETLLRQLGLDEFCDQEERECRLIVAGILWPPADRQVKRVEETAYIQVFVPMKQPQPFACTARDRQHENQLVGVQESQLPTRERQSRDDHEQDDQVNMMTYSGWMHARDTSLTQWAHVFKLGTDPPIYVQRIFQNEAEEGQHIRECMERNLRAPQGVALYRLNPQPGDLQQHDATGYLAIRQVDLPHENVLILVDYEFISNRPSSQNPAPRDGWRETLTTRAFVTRSMFLQNIGLTEFCLGEEDLCILWHGDQIWVSQDGHLRFVKNGDYIRVQIRRNQDEIPLADQWRWAQCGVQARDFREQQRREMAEWNHRRLRRDDYNDTSDTNSLLQLQAHVHRPAFASIARATLPPPGNGPVRFGEIEIKEGNRCCKYRDDLLASRFLDDFYQRLGEEKSANRFLKNLHEKITQHSKHVIKERRVISLENRLGRGKARTLCLEQLLPNFECSKEKTNCQHGDFTYLDSTAVQSENPRLRESEHVHDLFVHCEGLSDLAEQLTARGSIQLVTDVPYPEMWDNNFLQQISHWQPQKGPVTKVEIYTDGSALWSRQTGSLNAGWSTVVVVRDQNDQQHLLGFMASTVIVDTNDPFCTGAKENNSDAAEADALIWAGLWALQRPDFCQNVEIEFISDSRTKIRAAEGAWSAHLNAQALLTHGIMSSLFCTSKVRFTWTKAHCGTLFNELADHTAKSAARFPDEFWPNSRLPNLMEFGDAINWLWTAVSTKEPMRGMKVEKDAVSFRRPQPLTNEGFFNEHKITTSRQKVTMSVVFASFNVNTLKGKYNGIHKEAIVLKHMEDHGVGILGLQETRRRQTKEWRREHFFGISSAAVGGQGGVDLIVNTKIPYAWHRGIPLHFAQSDFSVMAAGPQFLAAKIKNDFLNMIVVSAHAPHCMADDSQKDVFWNHLVNTLQGVRLPVVLLIDANARLGQLQQEGVGIFGAEKVDENTEHFMRALKVLGLAVPATFERYVKHPNEDQGTWHHKNGLARIDYIGVPQEWMDHQMQADVLDVEMAETYKDHRMVWLTTEVCLESKVTERKKQIKPDRQAMTTMEGKETIRWLASTFCEATLHQEPMSSDVALWVYEKYMNDSLMYWFPPQKEVRKEHWISKETWSSLASLKRIRRYVRTNRNLEKRGILRQILQSWKDHTRQGPSPTWLKSMQTTRAWATRQCELLAIDTKEKLRKEEANFFDQCIKRFEERCSDSNATDLWKTIKRYLPKTKARVQSRAIRYSKTMENFEKHFAQNEEAKAMTGEQMQWRFHCNSKQALKMAGTFPLHIQQIPTLFEFEQALRRATPGKAYFSSAVPEWFAYAPRESAIALYPLLFDMFVYYQEPAAMKGGVYFPLWKQKGSQSAPENYRAILISSYVAKALHHIMRKRLVRSLPRVLQGMQIGGLPRQRVQYGSHLINLQRNYASRRHRSHSVVFFDLVSAFYQTPRELIVDNVLDYDDVPLVEEMTLLPISQETATEKAGIPKQLRGELQESLTCSFFNVMGVERDSSIFWVPEKGTRPGDSCADLSFTFVMTGILADFISDIEHLLPCIEIEGKHVRIPPVTWVDDVALVLEHEDPQKLLDNTAEVVKAMEKRTAQRGLQLNLKKGKTEALIRFQGPQSSMVHRRFRDGGCKIPFEDAHGNLLEVHGTSKYTHLGAVQSANMTNGAEVTMRIIKARAAYKDIKRKILGNPAIQIQKKCHIAQTLIFSRLLFGTEVWNGLHQKQEARLNTFLFSVYRTIVKKISRGNDQKFSTLEVEASLVCIKITQLIRLQRLRYMRKLGQEAPMLLLRLLEREYTEQQGSWLSLLREDLEWVGSHSKGQKDKYDGLSSLHEWWNKAMEQGKAWDKYVTRLVMKEAVQEHLLAKQKWTGQNTCIPTMPESGQRSDAREECDLCGAIFYGPAAFANHMWKRHHVHAKVRYFMSDTACGSCLRDYHSLQRVRQHLQYSAKCFHHLLQIWQPMDPLPFTGDALEAEAFRVPWVQRSGPRLPEREQWSEVAPGKVFPSGNREADVLACLLLCKDAANVQEITAVPSPSGRTVRSRVSFRIHEFRCA